MYCTTKMGFLEGIFCLCVENVMSVLDPFFLHIKLWCRSRRLFIYKVLVVISCQTGFVLKIVLKY